MSQDIIQANYDTLEEVAHLFEAAAQSIEEMLQEVRRGRDNLQGEWVGLGSDAFFSDMDGEVLPVSENLRDALAEASEVTRTISSTIHTAEEEAAALLTGQAEPPPTDSGQGAAPPSWWDQGGEWVHGGLDVAGYVPIIGEAADGLNALIYLAEGRTVEAGISAAAMIPLLGDVGKVGKWGVKGANALDAAGDAVRATGRLGDASELLGRARYLRHTDNAAFETLLRLGAKDAQQIDEKDSQCLPHPITIGHTTRSRSFNWSAFPKRRCRSSLKSRSLGQIIPMSWATFRST